MSELPKCKVCGCVGIHACMGQQMQAPTRKEKREFWREMSKAIKKIKKLRQED